MDIKDIPDRIGDALHSATSPDISTIMADLATLRHDVAVLATNSAKAATRSASDAGDDMRAEATRLYDGVTDASKTSARAVTAQVEAHPVVTLLLMFSLGYIASRLVAR